ncbi:MAG TPA: NAD(P)-binding domain-containing protein [Candidatus Limnocylindrales bacterium]
MREIEVVVVGAGQAGLATSYHLTQWGIEHVLLDRGKVAESWRTKRWDSFALNGPNWTFSLPGYEYDGPDRDAFMLRDELVTRFADYARQIDAPVEEGVDVISVGREELSGRYLLDTTSGAIRATAVVAATGAYQRRVRPPTGLDEKIFQLNTDEFRNATQLPDGGVLIVGSGQSGCQVAQDLREAGRDVWLATGTCGWMPRRYRGKDNVEWRWDMGMFDDSVEKLGHALRLACPPIQTGVDGGRDLNLGIVRAQGIHLTGRFLGANGYTVSVADDLQENATGSDLAAVAIRKRIDDFIAERGLDAPQPEPFEPAGDFRGAPTSIDLRDNGIRTVLWGTGFRLDFSWIDLDLEQSDGYPKQTQGVSPHDGLYFMGLQLMHTRKSGLIFGVGEDAEHVGSVIAARLDARARDGRN